MITPEQKFESNDRSFELPSSAVLYLAVQGILADDQGELVHSFINDNSGMESCTFEDYGESPAVPRHGIDKMRLLTLMEIAGPLLTQGDDPEPVGFEIYLNAFNDGSPFVADEDLDRQGVINEYVLFIVPEGPPLLINDAWRYKRQGDLSIEPANRSSMYTFKGMIENMQHHGVTPYALDDNEIKSFTELLLRVESAKN